ncbi:nuclear pore complex protein Nup85-like [Argiope bruennichi]|uniref:nuclear pore complex protein Nup85-like n=1 Tax=Argiope bruennichi TaxID=94029 RepID=UPI00249471FD|nr:nuclear pore complex protein Nup85-like [Argiope bruennichi]
MAANHSENPGISVLEIHDEDLFHGVQAIFSARNDFVTYGVQRGGKEKDVRNPPRYLHIISAKAALYNDYVRKLVNESHSVFLTLNTRIPGMQDERQRLEIAKTSQKYRCVLLACIEELHSAIESTGDEELIDLRQMFSDIELLWHLLQSLIIDTHSGSRVLYKLLDWIKWHFVFAEKKREDLIQTEEPCLHPDYWDTIIHFLLQGKIAPARSLLSMHQKSKREDFISLDELMKKMPMYGASSGISLNEFRIRWKHWQEECKTRLGRGEFSSDGNLVTVCKILCGDYEALSAKSNLCENWYHLMISVLLYTDPCISFSALGDIARTYYNNVTSSSWNKSNIVDSIILAAMELDIMSVINLACSFNDGWWFAVHIMDLFTHGNYIGNGSKDHSVKRLRTYLLRNYADTLMSHSSLWQVGADYLDYCDCNRELLELYLERIPIKTEVEARKIIYLAKKRNLDNLVKTVSNVMASRALSNGKLGTALTWVMYSKDVRFADEIADRWLKDYTKHQKVEGLEIFKNMGSCMLVSDKLTFVGKYCEFHKLYSEGDWKIAASLLISLIASGLAPTNFQIIMLLDALPLLEASEIIFSRKETYQLMKCLENAVMNKENKDTIGDSDRVNIIRLALVRNLSRSFVIETGDSESDEEM